MRTGKATEAGIARPRFRRLFRVSVAIMLTLAFSAGLPVPPAAAEDIRRVGTLDRRTGQDAIRANGNMLIDAGHRRGYQAVLHAGVMKIYEISLDTLREIRAAEIPELLSATTGAGPTEWLWTLDARARRAIGLRRTIHPTLPAEAFGLVTIDLATLKAVSSDIIWSATERLPLSISFHAPTQRLYFMTRNPFDVASRSRIYVEERTLKGSLQWEHELGPCFAALDQQFPPVAVRSVLQPSYLYANCYNYGNIQAQIVRLTLGSKGPTVEDTFAAVPGPLSVQFDPGSDRMFFLTTNGGAGRGAWVFDGLRTSFLGVIATGDASIGASEYAMGLDQETGRLYLQTRSGLIVADARRTPLPAGILYRSFAGGTTGTIVVDSISRRIYIPDPNVRNAQNHPAQYLILEDETRVSGDPPAGDPDALTTDIAEKPGHTAVNYSGVAQAFGMRSLTTGGVQRAAWNIALGQFSPEEEATGEMYQSLLGAPIDSANRDLSVARIRGVSLSNQSSEAASIAADSDRGTGRDLDRIGQKWPATASECLDGEGKPSRRATAGASASCDVGAALTMAQAAVQSVGELSAPMSTHSLAAFGSVQRDPSLGMVSRSIAVVRDLSIASRVHIAEIRSDAETRAAGRPGTARAFFTRSFHGVRADTNGDGTFDFACGICDPTIATAAITRALVGVASVEFPEPDTAHYPAGSKGGYQAIVKKNSFRAYAERSLNEDDAVEVVGMQLTFFADARAGRSRQVVQLAGVQAESHYGIYLTGATDDDGCGDCSIDDPEPEPTVTVDPVPGESAPPAPTAPPEVRGTKTITEKIMRRFAAGTQIALARPGDATLLGLLWAFLMLPAYLIWRRRLIGLSRR